MKQFKRKWLRTLLASVACLTMVATSMPVFIYAATDTEDVTVVENETSTDATVTEDENSTGEEIFKELTNLGKPEGYDENSKKHPYGYGNTKTSVLKASRVMLASSTTRSPKDKSKSYWLLKGYNKGKQVLYRDTAVNWNKKQISKNGDRMGEYAYLQAVSFDPDGDGLREIIAYIGVNKTKSNKYKVGVFTLNTNTGVLENNETFLGTAKWVNTKDGKSLDSAAGRSYFSITAGDYDADGKDTIVAYACLDGDNYGIFELSYKNGKLSIINNQGNKTLTHALYNSTTELHKNVTNKWYAGYKLKGQVTTGDLNNDGIDDLVVTSGIGKTNTKYDKQQIRQGYIAVSVGSDGMTGSVVAKMDDGIYISDGDISLSNLHSDIGNVFTDGYNRLTVVGNKITKDSKGEYQQLYGKNYPKSLKTRTYFYKLENGKLKQCNSGIDTSTPYDVDNIYKSQEYYRCNNVVPVCSAYVDGYGQQEQLFVNGSIYKVKDDGSLYCLVKKFDTNSGSGACIYEATAGTVDDNGYGIEQFLVSYKGKNVFSSGGLSAKCAIVYGNATYSDKGVLTATTKYKTDIGWPFDEATGDDSFSRELNMIMVPYESKQTDVTLLRLNNKGYYYANPEPVVALQAAPYFKEAGKTYAGTTQYSLTASYTKGTKKTASSAIGGGFSEMFQVATLFRQKFNSVYKSLVSTEFKKSIKNSFTTTFTAANKDTVVIQSTPVIYYSYDVYDPSAKQWKANAFGVTFAQIPVYKQITVDEYNAFAEYYNKYIKEHPVQYTYGGKTKTVKAKALNVINKDTYYLGNAGNPNGYCKVWAELPGGKRASKGAMALGYQGGSSTVNYGYETSQEKINTTGWSLDSSLTVQLGGSIKGLVQCWLGGTYNNSKGSSTATVKTNGNGYSISGTVKNLDLDALTISGQLSESAVTSYNFQWTFGQSLFTSHNGTNAASIPLLCYVVNNVTKGLSCPTIKTLEETEDNTLKITWSAPDTSDGQTIEGYNVYLGDIDGNFTKITDKPLTADELSYEYTPADKIAYYSFVVTAVGKSTASQTKTIESLPSKSKATIFDGNKS